MENEEKEKLEIKCPNCSGSKKIQNVPDMNIDKDYIFCSICGLLLPIKWIKQTTEILKELGK